MEAKPVILDAVTHFRQLVDIFPQKLSLQVEYLLTTIVAYSDAVFHACFENKKNTDEHRQTRINL